MKIPQLSKKPETKSCHNTDWEDNYSWIHQKNILEVLKDSQKLNPEVKKYLEEENSFTEFHMSDTKKIQKDLFKEIKGRIKLDDESLPYKDHAYEYWTKTTVEGNYSIKLRKKIGTNVVEEIWNGDKEKEKIKTEYFGIGDLEVSYNDKMLGYSLDLKGSEYYTIYIREISSNKQVTDKIEDTTGGITFSLDDKFIFYSKLDQNHRPRKIFRHKIGTSTKNDILIFEEKTEAFTVGISISSDEKYFFINTSDHNTSEKYYFSVNEETPKPKLIRSREKGIIYSINSWDNYFYMHTNKDAEDFKIERCKDINAQKWETFIAPKEETLIGGLLFLNKWIVRSEVTNALDKIFVKNIETNKEEELIFTDESVYESAVSHIQKDKNTDLIYIAYSTPKTQSRAYLYNLKTKEKKLVKEQIIPSGHDSKNYIVERLECESHDGRKVPITITRHKDTPVDGSAHLLLYGYGSYGATMNPRFSSTRLSLLDRGFVYAIAHIRGSQYLGRDWYEDGRIFNKKNTFKDFISVSEHLIENNYTSPNHLYAMGGSAGGLLMGAVMNMSPELYNGVISAVPFVDVVTTMLDESIPLTTGEYDEWGDPNIKEFYDYMLSYSPYDNIKNVEYPNTLVTTGLHDSQVQYWEPAKWVAKLRDYHQGDNKIILHTDMDAGHSGSSGRFEALKEIAMEYAFLFMLEGINK